VPIKRFKPPVATKLGDKDADRVRQNHDDRIREIQGVPIVGGRLFRDIELEANVETPISHCLGRKATILVSPLRGDLTETRLIMPSAFQAGTEANVTPPAGSTDYWTATGTSSMSMPLPLKRGETVSAVGMNYYRGQATEPTFRLLSGQAGASATVLTETVAWSTTVGLNTWGVVRASYNESIGADLTPNMFLDVTMRALDRLRSAFVTVNGSGAVQEIRSADYDPAKYSVLLATGFDGTAVVDVWVF
jgi:hypothetical protein